MYTTTGTYTTSFPYMIEGKTVTDLDIMVDYTAVIGDPPSGSIPDTYDPGEDSWVESYDAVYVDAIDDKGQPRNAKAWGRVWVPADDLLDAKIREWLPSIDSDILSAHDDSAISIRIMGAV